MADIGFFTQLSNEISTLELSKIIFLALLFYIPFYFSKKAQTLFFHLLYTYFGFYILFKMEMTSIIYNVDLPVALGLLIPQVKFILQFVKDTIQTIKMMSANTYYFFITIYYKILRFLNWIKSTYIMLKIFFTTFSFKKEDYQEQSSHDYSHKQKHQKFYEEPKQEKQKSYSKQEDSSYKKQESKSEYEEQSYTKYEEPKREAKKEHGEFERFYSESAYTVLGVSADDDYKSIKKTYRKLVREYHPDLNPDNIDKYTEITQLIDSAWEKVEGWKK